MSSFCVYRYVGLRILPIIVEVDSASLLLLGTDLFSSLGVVSRDEALASFSPQKWIDEFNGKLLSPEQRLKLVDVYKSQVRAQEMKIYFENFVLHPLKVTLSFQQTPFPRPKETTAADFLAAFAAVDRMEIKLNSFIVDNVIESSSTLKSRVISRHSQDLQRQIHKIAGSLSLFGSPVGFARNVGNGVQAFFYEPYQGLVQSPQDFVLGIGKGTTSLVTGVVSGALTSTAQIVGSATSGLSMLSGDEDFQRSRNVKAQKAARGGLLSGIKGGGQSVVEGISSGVTGLFTKPYEEAQKDGAIGFIRGVGMGVLGAAVKPVIGVTDGLTSVAHGISNELSDNVTRNHVRPPRAFSRSEADPSELILTPLNEVAASAQARVLKAARKAEYSDAFVDAVQLDSTTRSTVILSEKYFWWIISKERQWTKPWSGISHCTFIQPQSIGVVTYENNGKNDIITIPCKGRVIAMQLYEVLVANAFRMGNPTSVVSISVMLSGNTATAKSTTVSGESAVNLSAAAIDGYRFGTANAGPPIPLQSGSSGEDRHIIRRAEARFKDCDGEWSSIDLICWSLVREWDIAHTGLSASRCCVLLLINRSSNPIQISRVQIKHGKSVKLIPIIGYDSESKHVNINGCVAFFSVANSPAIEPGHAGVTVITSVGTVTASTKAAESAWNSLDGINGGFLEKSVSDWWSKNVFCIW